MTRVEVTRQPVQPGAVEVGLGEAGLAELGPGHDRRSVAGEGLVDLHLVGRDAGPGVAAAEACQRSTLSTSPSTAIR